MNKATNKATTGNNKSNGKKVSHAKLSVCVTEYEKAQLHEATALAHYVVIGQHVAENEKYGLQKQVAEAVGESEKFISMMKKVWLAHEHSRAEGDDEFSWEEHSSLNKAYTAACKYIGTQKTSRPKAEPKAQPKSSGKVTADALIKSLGKAEAKKLALAILANV